MPHPRKGSILVAEGTVRRRIALHTSRLTDGSIELAERIGVRCEK
jgi:hypothetical protein